MTTNVLDLVASIAVTDSRWSISTPSFFVYLDDPGFEKMVAKKPFLFVFAGAGSLIQKWKDWANALPNSLHDMPDFSKESRAMAITITDMDKSAVLFERIQRHVEFNARFAGSGALHAFAYWKDNGDAMGAVRSAILMDRCSGGEIKFYKFDGRNNLDERIRFEQLVEIFSKKGLIMRTNQNTEQALVPINEEAARDPEVACLVSSITSGQAEIISPCEEMYIPWKEEEKRRFTRVATNIAKNLGGE